MRIENVYAVYFSATYSTGRIVRGIADSLGARRTDIDVTGIVPEPEVHLGPSDLLVVGVPAYGGRVPVNALAGLDAIKGSGTPAVIVSVYGNRDYDDTLVELQDIVMANGFVPVAAAAVIARHCIFPKVAAGRPDAEDMVKIKTFCDQTASVLDRYVPGSHDIVTVRGNRPYKRTGSVPIHPSAGKECDRCGACAELCPVGAIPKDRPMDTDTDRCISCARCINVCPKHARDFRGMLYRMAGWKFSRDNSERKEPEFMTI